MIKSLLMSFVLLFSFSLMADQHQHDGDKMKKAEEKKEAATEEGKDQKKEADEALKKVQKMTSEARGAKKEEKKTK